MAKVKLLDPSDPRRKLDRYELIGEIATGGMATVFLARLAGVGGFQRFVAIKRLHPHLANEQEFVEMFLDEARLAALIHHPNVVPILEVGVTDAGYYIVMEYVEGDTLSKIVARSMSGGKMVPRPILMRCLLDTLAGLHTAHDLCDDRGNLLGLVHRDVSPQNVLVGVDGTSRITDFGVARATARLTSTGSGKLKGKLAYMAPEQTRGDELDRRTDLFAAGIIIWECLVGRRLFKADSEAATLSRILVDPIRAPSAINSDVPKPFDVFAMKALDRDPARRYQNAAEMGDALEAAANEAAKATPGVAGVATVREVKAYVQMILGQEIGAQRESVRAWLAQTDSQPKISLPPMSQRRPRLNSDHELSDVSQSITGKSALKNSAELPVTHLHPSTGAPPAPLADVTMRFALQSQTGKSSKPRPAAGDAADAPIPLQRTRNGDSNGVPDLSPPSSRDDGDDAVTMLKPSDPPPNGAGPIAPTVKTARGLFAADLLPASQEEAARNASNGRRKDPGTLAGLGELESAAVVQAANALNGASAHGPGDGPPSVTQVDASPAGAHSASSPPTAPASSSLTNASMTLSASSTAREPIVLDEPKRSRVPIFLGVAALLAFGGVGAWLLLKDPPARTASDGDRPKTTETATAKPTGDATTTATSKTSAAPASSSVPATSAVASTGGDPPVEPDHPATPPGPGFHPPPHVTATATAAAPTVTAVVTAPTPPVTAAPQVTATADRPKNPYR